MKSLCHGGVTDPATDVLDAAAGKSDVLLVCIVSVAARRLNSTAKCPHIYNR